ncbi:uncharacterized protein LOC111887777 [Lactuca sativa]|uniref:Uncharacterized protein n=1 Tax=Lactuca sativa TaxID=4236 RepID=A0A9R1V3N6_LACSA|nr:uncharacterized protein LOC111887777 [Lactuca sativa]XP_042752631.1 uncharacterized protein LOC111887777 [Lactuca sativa]XP_042752632.1 uncharacterized protein LOC111887777 [Lactuca sativa]XP_042752633.1 uncharacterized protein LOC111887777 [Lactuca sativa]XP_042752634.1 uncharacterized protein LOC111887777 [Lactuca sativa]XP_042752635.1 uncharacterized protein LOC111887777 [Lactuca sativa]XP_042752636.1 uncharacterized protein LOC111887777 [Lactuca sativa]XP_042752637.1 uncharacterized p
MERTEPTFVPEWLKSSGGLSTSHQSSSLHPDEQGVSKSSKSLRNKSLDNELQRVSVSDRTTSSYFRRSSISNGSALSRSYSSFNRNNRDRDRDRDRDWEKDNNNNNRQKDYSDPLANILPTRFEKEGLRRSFSGVSGKRADSWPRKVASDLSIANKSSNVKTSFERDFPSLGTDEKQVDNDIGRVPSPGLSSAIQSLPIGNPAVIGGDGWTSALAEVPVIVGSNGNTTAVQPSSVSATTSMTGGRNMAETLAHGPPRIQTAPQLNAGTQRLEELAVKQSRQLIPMTPSLPKALADKPKLKVNQSQIVNHPHSPRHVVSSMKPEVSKTSTVGKLLVLKPSRERNGISPTTKESLSPTASSSSSAKLPNSPLAIPSVPVVEKRPSSQAQSRSNFFNLMRKKSMSNNSSSGEKSGEQVADPPPPPPPPPPEGGSESTQVKVNGDAIANVNDNGKHHDVILYSEEEEARFLRSLGWDETAEDEEEEGLTEEEISSFYRNYLSLKPASKYLKGTEAKVLMRVGEMEMEISSDSKVDA